jgi:hypothetical protein
VKINRRSEAAIHMERHRDMLVFDHPFAIELSVTHGSTNPNVGFGPVRPLSSDPVDAVAEGSVISGSNYQLVLLAAQRA